MTDQRRSTQDRRRRPTAAISRYTFLRGRRRGPRRAGDPKAVYVDDLGLDVAILVLSIFVFHCLDAILTLAHLARNGRELNPIMGYFLSLGPFAFVGAKLGMAAIGLSFLAVHKNFPYVRAGITTLFVIFAGVIGYQLFLLLHV